MKLISADFKDGGDLPEKFTCQGEGISPPLQWSEVPEGTKSLALILSDPDAPSGNFIHWQIINIPVKTTGIDQNQIIGDELPNATGASSYVPPCPPSGKHRYIFSLYALNIDHLDPASVGDFNSVIQPHIIEKAQLTGLFQKD